LYKCYKEAENYDLSSSFHRLYHTWIKSLYLFLATRKFQELFNDSKPPLTWTVQNHCVCITIPFDSQFGCQEKPNLTVQDSRLLSHCSNQNHQIQEAWLYQGVASNYPMVSQMTTAKYPQYCCTMCAVLLIVWANFCTRKQNDWSLPTLFSPVHYSLTLLTSHCIMSPNLKPALYMAHTNN
jgi:hypothetical protein